MSREEMLELLDSPPVRISMNNGAEYIVTPDKSPSAGTLTLVFLQEYEDNVFRHVHLPYVAMAEVLTDAPMS